MNQLEWIYNMLAYGQCGRQRRHMRTFETGATRDTDETKLDYEGFLSPLVIQRYAEFMHDNRLQADGVLRASDNWQKGMPLDAYMKSGWRHFMEWWSIHRRKELAANALEVALCALIFNASGYLHELLKAKRVPTSTSVFRGLQGLDRET